MKKTAPFLHRFAPFLAHQSPKSLHHNHLKIATSRLVHFPAPGPIVLLRPWLRRNRRDEPGQRQRSDLRDGCGQDLKVRSDHPERPEPVHIRRADMASRRRVASRFAASKNSTGLKLSVRIRPRSLELSTKPAKAPLVSLNASS